MVRITAFDNLELLVEQIDNATNLEILKLWPPLLSLLSSSSSSSSSEPEIRRYAAWTIGTAVQNNPKAQLHLYQYQGIKRLIESLKNDVYTVRTKVLYALGSELNNFPKGMEQFSLNEGWKVLRRSIEEVDEGTECQRRVAFFIAHYLGEESCETKEIEENGFLEGFVNVLGDEKHAHQVDLLDKVQTLEETANSDITISNNARQKTNWNIKHPNSQKTQIYFTGFEITSCRFNRSRNLENARKFT